MISGVVVYDQDVTVPQRCVHGESGGIWFERRGFCRRAGEMV
jgi:hypothetical protein